MKTKDREQVMEGLDKASHLMHIIAFHTLNCETCKKPKDLQGAGP